MEAQTFLVTSHASCKNRNRSSAQETRTVMACCAPLAQTVNHTHINKLTQKQDHTTEHWRSEIYLSFCGSNITRWRTDAEKKTQTVNHTHKHKQAHTCNQTLKIAILPHFLTIEPHFVRKGCTRRRKLAILLQFLTLEPHFVRKGCDGRRKLAIYFSFWRSNLIACERVATDGINSQFYFNFWRSNLISCESVAFRDASLALPQALREK